MANSIQILPYWARLVSLALIVYSSLLLTPLAVPTVAAQNASQGNGELTGEIEWSDGDTDQIGSNDSDQREETSYSDSLDRQDSGQLDSGQQTDNSGLTPEEQAKLNQEFGEIAQDQQGSSASQALQNAARILIQVNRGGRQYPTGQQPPVWTPGNYPSGQGSSGQYPSGTTGGSIGGAIGGSPLDGPWGGKMTHPPPRFFRQL